MKTVKIVILASLILASCNSSDKAIRTNQKEKTMISDTTKQYGYNRDFLKKYTDVIEIKNSTSSIVIAPAWQGRVMTSSCEGDAGFSFGWINHDLISSGKVLPHINAYGGEERLWLGPEGGQYSIFFSKGKSFIFDNWQTPAFLDTTPFEVISKTDTSARFVCTITTANYSGFVFKLKIEREVILMSEKEMINQAGKDIRELNCVAYQSVNRIINQGSTAWSKETGLLSVWMLGMFNPSPSVVVVIPVNEGDEIDLGPMVNDNYFGKISGDRLKVSGNHILFKADGKSRGKIGIPPLRTKGTMGSYDSDNNILTILKCELPAGRMEYVNSSWEIQDDPYSGDALNSYNDGPLEDGTQMGPFYELETSSPAANLKPGESMSHMQVTMHLTGDFMLLDKVARDMLGIGLEKIKSAF